MLNTINRPITEIDRLLVVSPIKAHDLHAGQRAEAALGQTRVEV